MKYGKKVFVFFKFVVLFMKEFIKSNLSVAYVVCFFKRSQISSRIVSYDTSDLSRFETLTLSHLITLTPGTITASIDEDCSRIQIHMLTVKTLPNRAISYINQELKPALLRLTR